MVSIPGKKIKFFLGSRQKQSRKKKTKIYTMVQPY